MTARPSWMDAQPDPRDEEAALQAEDFCEQCGRLVSELCPAFGDDVARSGIDVDAGGA